MENSLPFEFYIRRMHYTSGLGLQPITSSLGLGCLINNGGTANLTGLTAVKPRMMMDMFSVNVVGPLMLTKASVAKSDKGLLVQLLFPKAREHVNVYSNSNDATLSICFKLLI